MADNRTSTELFNQWQADAMQLLIAMSKAKADTDEYDSQRITKTLDVHVSNIACMQTLKTMLGAVGKAAKPEAESRVREFLMRQISEQQDSLQQFVLCSSGK